MQNIWDECFLACEYGKDSKFYTADDEVVPGSIS